MGTAGRGGSTPAGSGLRPREVRGMAIGSFLIKVEPEATENVEEALRFLAGVEVHRVPDSPDLVVVLEADTKEGLDDLALRQMPSLEGVAGVYLTYLHME